jgi:hypothetical protein
MRNDNRRILILSCSSPESVAKLDSRGYCHGFHPNEELVQISECLILQGAGVNNTGARQDASETTR